MVRVVGCTPRRVGTLVKAVSDICPYLYRDTVGRVESLVTHLSSRGVTGRCETKGPSLHGCDGDHVRKRRPARHPGMPSLFTSEERFHRGERTRNVARLHRVEGHCRRTSSSSLQLVVPTLTDTRAM